MFGLSESASVGKLVEEVFAGADVRDVVTLVQRTRRPKVKAAELEPHEIYVPWGKLHVAEEILRKI